MTETTASCGRCSQTIEDTPIGVSVDGGPLHSTDPVLRICPEHAASLARWLKRGRRRAVSPRPMVQEPEFECDAHDYSGGRGPRNTQKIYTFTSHCISKCNSYSLVFVCFVVHSVLGCQPDGDERGLLGVDEGIVLPVSRGAVCSGSIPNGLTLPASIGTDVNS